MPGWCRAKILAALAKRFVDPGLQKKWPRKKSFLVIGIESDMKAGGVSLGTISRNYEGVGNPSVYSYFERLFRPALRGHRLSFRRISSKRAADSRHTSCGWRYDHASWRDVHVVESCYHYEGHHDSGADHGRFGYWGLQRSNCSTGQS